MKPVNIFLLIIFAVLIAACISREPSDSTDTVQRSNTYQHSALSPLVYHGQQASANRLYVIERKMPNAGKLTPQQLKEASQLSSHVIDSLGPQIKWIHSYVTEDKMYCIYRSPNKELIQDHAEATGLPANANNEAGAIIGPLTATIKD